MILKKIKISNFRNYEKSSLEFHDGINIIYGNNGQGKTNLLESIYVLALTKSHRSFIDQHLIQKGKESATIKGTLLKNDFPKELEVVIKKTTKAFQIDQNKIKKSSDYISNMNIIIFYPEDLEIIKGSPAIRRRYLNTELSQIYSHYINILSDYNKLLKFRNDYLKKISRNEPIDSVYFEILNQYFIDKAILIYKMRKKFVEKLNQYCTDIFYDLSGLSNFLIHYHSFMEFDDDSIDDMKLKMKEKLTENFSTEKKLGTTLTGPHRDDLEFYLNDINLKNYGSQGQQRMAVLALKLSEVQMILKKTEETPILLLDDVFSELDQQKKNNLLKYIQGNIQTIITTTDLDQVDPSIVDESKLIKISHGNVESVEEVKKHGRK